MADWPSSHFGPPDSWGAGYDGPTPDLEYIDDEHRFYWGLEMLRESTGKDWDELIADGTIDEYIERFEEQQALNWADMASYMAYLDWLGADDDLIDRYA